MKIRTVAVVVLLVFSAGLAMAQKSSVPLPKEGVFTDPRDGQKYRYKTIGKQTWMLRNLNYNAPKSKIYQNNPSFGETYGRLYDWETAKQVAPTGWHLPTSAEWKELILFVGGWNVAGGVLKEKGTAHWRNPNIGASDKFGFSVLGGGRYNVYQIPWEMGETAHFWTSSTAPEQCHAIKYIIVRDETKAKTGYDLTFEWSSVRCVRNR